MPHPKAPTNFGDSKTREMVDAFLKSEPNIGKRSSSDPITRLINKDDQGVLYVALLESKENPKHEEKN